MWRRKIDGYFKAEVPCIFSFVKFRATVARDISFSINYISILDMKDYVITTRRGVNDYIILIF